eukprot:COSAG01_NODE_2011_length_8656_cov_4.852402_2_plen_641_part_00
MTLQLPQSLRWRCRLDSRLHMSCQAGDNTRPAGTPAHATAMPSEGEAGTGLGRDGTVGTDTAVECGQQVEGEVMPSGQAGGVGDRELRVPPLPLAPVPEKILGSRLVTKGEEFQIKWVGVDEPTWKPASDCQAYANHILAWRRESTGSRAGMSVGGVGGLASLPLSQQLVASAARSGLAPPSNDAASCSTGTAAGVAPNQRGGDSGGGGGGGGGGDEQPAAPTAAAGDIDQDAATASIGDAASTAHPDTDPPAATAKPDHETVPLGQPASDGGSSDSLGSEQQRQPEATATGISSSQESQPGAGSVERSSVPSTLPSGEALASTEKLPGGLTGGDDQQGDDTTGRESTDGGVAAADSVCQEVPQTRAPPERKWECAQCGRSWTKHRAYTGHLRYCLQKYPRSSRDLVNECPDCVPGSGKLRGHLGRHLTRSRDQVKPDKQPPPPQPSAEERSNKRSAEEGEGDDDGSLPTRRRSSRRMTSATEEGPGGQAAAVKEEVEKAGPVGTSEGSTRRSKRASAGMAPKTLLQEAADAREVAAVTEAEKAAAAAAADAEAAAESEATEAAAAAAQAKGKLKVVPTRRVGRGKAVRDPTCHDSHTLFRMHLHRQCCVWAVSWTYGPSCSALSGHTTCGRGEIRCRIN